MEIWNFKGKFLNFEENLDFKGKFQSFKENLWKIKK